MPKPVTISKKSIQKEIDKANHFMKLKALAFYCLV